MASLIRLEWTAACIGPCGELYRGTDGDAARKAAEKHSKTGGHPTSQNGCPAPPSDTEER